MPRKKGKKGTVDIDKKERPLITLKSGHMKQLKEMVTELDAEFGRPQKAPPLPTYNTLLAQLHQEEELDDLCAAATGVHIKKNWSDDDCSWDGGPSDESAVEDDWKAEDVVISDLLMESEGGVGVSCLTGKVDQFFCPGALQVDRTLEGRLRKDWKERVKSRQYRRMLETRQNLPIFEYKHQLIEIMDHNQVCVVSGETGCGKSTQVPQFLLEAALESGTASSTFIVVTQPRRISAIALAQRVSQERAEPLGKSTGYLIRMEGRRPRNRGGILYCTNGVLLRWLLSDEHLSRVSHVVLDEIHERDLFSDFLLIVVRDLLRIRKDLKIVLMSATVNAAMFSQYFHSCPVLEVPGRLHPVRPFFLEDVFQMTGYLVPIRGRPLISSLFQNLPVKRDQVQATRNYYTEMERFVRKLESSGKYSQQTLKSLRNWDEKVLDLDLVAATVSYVVANSPSHEAILVFLPGWTDIKKLSDRLNYTLRPASRFWIIPLHSLLPSLDQAKVFSRPPSGCRKVVLSTNLAETSITVDDVVHVIDCGKIKISNFDVRTNIQTLQAEWVSRANAEQRRGRAGRVQAGFCYHLFTSWRWEQMERFLPPEMLRTRLENLCLQIKLLGLGKVAKFLRKAPQPPTKEAITLALQELYSIGALEPTEETLTPLGWHLARLPVDPHCGKMIIYSALFNCVDPVLTVAACLDYKDPFHTPMGLEEELDKKKLELAGVRWSSDYCLWIEALLRLRQEPKPDSFAREFFLSEGTAGMVERMKKQFAELLHSAGFLPRPRSDLPESNFFSDCPQVVSAVICAGLYPKIAHSLPMTSSNRREPIMLTTNPKNKWSRVFIHPKSVNFSLRQIKTRYIAYHQVMQSTKLYLHDCGMVSPLSLALFAGDSKFRLEDGHGVVVLDDWIKFYASRDVAVLLTSVRGCLDAILKRKVDLAAGVSAAEEDHDLETRFLEKIVHVLVNEEIQFKDF